MDNTTKNKILKVFFVSLLFVLVNKGLQAHACGGCSPSPFSLFYNYVLPNNIKAYTNPLVRTASIVNVARNPRSLATPCGFSNTYVNGRYLLTNLSHSLPNTPHKNISQYNYLGTATGISNPFINTSANAYVSGYNPEEQLNSNQDKSFNKNGYYDNQSQSYVWILPETSQDQ